MKKSISVLKSLEILEDFDTKPFKSQLKENDALSMMSGLYTDDSSDLNQTGMYTPYTEALYDNRTSRFKVLLGYTTCSLSVALVFSIGWLAYEVLTVKLGSFDIIGLSCSALMVLTSFWGILTARLLAENGLERRLKPFTHWAWLCFLGICGV